MLRSVIAAGDFGQAALAWIEAASLVIEILAVAIIVLAIFYALSQVLLQAFREMEERWPWQGHASAHRCEPPAGEPGQATVIHSGGVT